MTPSFEDDSTAYETWLRTQCDVVEADLQYKHSRMKKNEFVFLRATYFRWARQILDVCPELKNAPVVPSVGDTHVENFGTWRDAEGRLVWGVNDFDEAADIPYLFDLVRLATSVRLSPKLTLDNGDAAEAIVEGYLMGLGSPRPVLLDEQETWLRPYVVCSDVDRSKFWKEIDSYPNADPPPQVAHDLLGSIPESASVMRFTTRTKGGGSLGRPRYVVIAMWRGGKIVREAKALVPSAWNWAHGSAQKSRFLELANGKYRSPDPFLGLKSGYVVRRIAADSRKVDLGVDADKVTNQLLRLMGFDVGSIHAAADGATGDIRKDMNGRPEGWLSAAAKAAATAVAQDYADWTS